MDSTFIADRITATKALIIAYEDAVLALAAGGIQEYTIDTGQTVQKVTKLDLDNLNTVIDSLYNRCSTLEARLNGGSVTVRPCW